MKKIFMFIGIILATTNISFADNNNSSNYEVVQCGGCSIGAGSCFTDSNRRTGRMCSEPINGQCAIGYTQCLAEVEVEEEDCPNCPSGTSGEASYDLEIEMGGFKDGLYVCEVGFNAHKCAAKNRNPKGDHIVVGSEIITVESGAKTFSAEEAITAGSAKVYLNSSNYGAAYYVKYCYDYTKVVVGDAAHLATLDLEGDFYGNVTLDIADGGGYYSHAGVEGNVTVTCGGVVEATPISLDSNLEQSVPFSHLFNLNGPVNTPLQNGCTFEIEFSETMRDYVRQLKDDNSTYSATISTGVKFWMDLLY